MIHLNNVKIMLNVTILIRLFFFVLHSMYEKTKNASVITCRKKILFCVRNMENIQHIQTQS